jgi:hypothetical protein
MVVSCAVIEDANAVGDSNDAETVQYSIKTGNTLLQVIRGFQGTAKAWNVDTVVARNFTEYDYRALKHNLETISIDMQGTLKSGTVKSFQMLRL